MHQVVHVLMAKIFNGKLMQGLLLNLSSCRVNLYCQHFKFFIYLFILPYSLTTNTVVQTYDAGRPVWSCCWCLDDTNYIYAGLVNGSILVYDLRDTRSHVQELVPQKYRYGFKISLWCSLTASKLSISSCAGENYNHVVLSSILYCCHNFGMHYVSGTRS